MKLSLLFEELILARRGKILKASKWQLEGDNGREVLLEVDTGQFLTEVVQV